MGNNRQEQAAFQFSKKHTSTKCSISLCNNNNRFHFKCFLIFCFKKLKNNYLQKFNTLDSRIADLKYTQAQNSF